MGIVFADGLALVILSAGCESNFYVLKNPAKNRKTINFQEKKCLKIYGRKYSL